MIAAAVLGVERIMASGHRGTETQQ